MSGPASPSAATVDGLAVTRRRPEDVDDGAPAIVLVHGAMDRAASFSRVMRRLGHLDVIAFDRRGYAGSNGAGVAPTIAAHAGDLATIVEWSGAARVVVVGHSLGGTIALALVADDLRPGAGRVVGVGAFESPMPSLDGSYDEVGGGAVEVGLRLGPAAAAEHFYRLMVGEQVWSRLRDKDRSARLAEGPALLAELIDLRSPDRVASAPSVRVPALVGLGGTSSVRLRERALDLAEHLGGPRPFVIDRAGHGAHLTHPDDFARYVERCVGLTSGATSVAPDSLR